MFDLGVARLLPDLVYTMLTFIFYHKGVISKSKVVRTVNLRFADENSYFGLNMNHLRSSSNEVNYNMTVALQLSKLNFVWVAILSLCLRSRS